MDLINYLERAAVEADALWSFEVTQDQLGPDVSRAGTAFADNTALAQLLDARPTMICMVATPDDGETEEAEDSPEAPEPIEDIPDGQDPDSSSQS